MLADGQPSEAPVAAVEPAWTVDEVPAGVRLRTGGFGLAMISTRTDADIVAKEHNRQIATLTSRVAELEKERDEAKTLLPDATSVFVVERIKRQLAYIKDLREDWQVKRDQRDQLIADLATAREERAQHALNCYTENGLKLKAVEERDKLRAELQSAKDALQWIRWYYTHWNSENDVPAEWPRDERGERMSPRKIADKALAGQDSK